MATGPRSRTPGADTKTLTLNGYRVASFGFDTWRWRFGIEPGAEYDRLAVKDRRRDRRGRSLEEESPEAGFQAEVRSLARRVDASEPLDPASARTLQRTAGNQATLRHLGEGQPLEGATRARM